MDYPLISFSLEQQLKNELNELFEGEIIEKVTKKAKVNKYENIMLNMQEGQSFKITPKLSPNLFALCESVMKALMYEEKIEFFIMNSSDTNAIAFPKQEDDDSHLIIITSSLIEKFDSEELKFIIGHEIGHLISEYSRLEKIIDFVFPPRHEIPLVLLNKITLWKKLAELTADRYGFIASQNLDKVISVFFKLASGLDPEGKIDFNPDAYLIEMTSILEQYRERKALFVGTHPVNPIRLKALEYFSGSKLFSDILEKNTTEFDGELDKKVGELASLLTILDNTDLSYNRSLFLVTGGLIIANVDEGLVEDELEGIIDNLSRVQLFPVKFINDIMNSPKDEIMEMFLNSVQNILKVNPAERFTMLDYLINIALVDRKIMESEIDLLYEIGEKILGISAIEIAQHIGDNIRKRFIPKFY